MDPLLFDLAIAAVSLGLFGGAYGLALLATRPARPQSAPPSPDLGEEPPAVVNLLANRWRLNEDAAEATLLDLAARRLIEFRQPANDPMQTTIHLRDGEPGELRPYERRVLDRVRGLAVNGVIPVTALTFRNNHQAKVWTRRLHREVTAEAHRSGLSRRRFGPGIISALTTVAGLAATGLGVATLRYVLRNPSEDNDPMTAIGVGIVAFFVLTGLVASQRGERDTPAGREVATRWLGVRQWLRRHEEFADLPPAAVAVWDRYLPYGAALGVTHTASAVLDLGMGNRKLVWSSYGGSWHRVRVRYPRFWTRYGRTAPYLVFRAMALVLFGAFLIWLHGLSGRAELPAEPWVLQGQDLVGRVGFGLGVLFLAWGGYRILRTVIDLATTRTITGEVLWTEVWRSTSGSNNNPSVPWLHYLAIDDGSDDRTTAWGRPATLPSHGCRETDVVTIRVRPWTRRIVELTVVERGRARELVDAPTPDETTPAGSLAGRAGRAATLAAPPVTAAALLTGDEVAQALGVAVRPPESFPTPGMVAAAFSSADRGRQVLLVHVVVGAPGRWAWRMNRRGTELPGVGDGAYLSGDRAALRVGETTVVLTLMHEGKGRQAHLPWLLQQAAARLAAAP